MWIFNIFYICFYICFFSFQGIIESSIGNKVAHIIPHIKLPNQKSINETDALFYCLTAIATLAIVIVAYTQIRKLRENSESEFLLRIDERWTSKEILFARTIIHEIYLTVCNERKLSTDSMIQREIGKRIKKMSETIEEKRRFMLVLNLLDFLETIGYLHKEENIKTPRLQALLGESLIFHYNVFRPYIRHKRRKHGSKNFYKAFENLYNDLTNDK